ncbi:GDSL-type esterase/lipase family protein [Mucilaginibacter sabulilitoris]|uniref:GDSL-type esterase/lipase family protein n=1 Tax=Mucilaginibacter sabulilitoris TaxID=1173583 RepID=A0ABZ0TPC3_9SPHI|nr:GDSL-type esterase/lipase family protein [Mucilaginibacter sabulilitoris]WPU94752.1 GDSL-type esterase/lipase family protein [Mucilaginibacter sabulilitoris]
MKTTLLCGLLFLSGLFTGCKKNETAEPAGHAEHSLSSHLKTNAIATVLPGSPDDPNILYFGRWDKSNSLQYNSAWGGAYLKTQFTGTTVKIKVGTTVTNYYYRIDNGPWVIKAGVSGTVDLTPSPLSAGPHSLIVAQGKDYSYVFTFQGLVLDPGASTSAPAVGVDLIEYIGDSITAGYFNTMAEVSDYAWIAAEQLGAEHTQIAYPGIALVTGYGVNADKTGMDMQYFKTQSLAFPSSPNWDFSNYSAKIVVINLGQNDGSSAEPDSLFQSHYATLLAEIRTKFPNAHIFALRTFLGGRAAPTQAAVNSRIAAGDDNVYFIDTNGWLTPNSPDYRNSNDVHPSDAGQIKAANKLAPILSSFLTGGTTPSPYIVDNCDAATNWTSQNTLTLNTTDKKEGNAALQSLGSGTLEFQKHFTAFNPGATTANGGAIQFWYYVSDVSKLSSSNQIELGSGGNADINEYNWNIGPLVNGWNFISKTFASAGTTGGIPDITALNWLRIYHSKTASVTTRIDGIRIVHY